MTDRGRTGDEPPNNWLSVFGGRAWERVVEADGAKEQWYLHLFDATQPDLNWRNPEVGDLFEEILRFWLDRGVDGFRIDVAHSLVKEEGLRDQLRTSTHLGIPAMGADGGITDPHDDDEPMWDQPEVHDIYRRWHQVLAEYPGDRMTVAEAWTKTPESMAHYVRPDELSQSFNFAWLVAPWSAAAFTDVITTTLEALRPVGARPTWVLSNHDVVRHVTRYGGGPTWPGPGPGRHDDDAGAARVGVRLPGRGARPGPGRRRRRRSGRTRSSSAPASCRAGRLSGAACRGAARSRRTASARAADSPGCRSPRTGRSLTVERQLAEADSTLQFYRRALAARRTLAGTGEEVDMLDLGDDVLAFRRGPLTVVLNCGTVEARLPEGEVVLTSGRLLGRLLPPDTAAWLR